MPLAYADVAREALARVWRWLTEPRWPEGEPLLTESGLRYGTRVADGTEIYAPGFDVVQLSGEDQSPKAITKQRDAAEATLLLVAGIAAAWITLVSSIAMKV